MAPASMLTFLAEQTCGKMLDTTASLEGRVVIVTGSNAGLGLAAAIQFARLNPSHLILAVRSASRGAAAVETIKAATGYAGLIEVWELDLGNFDSVIRFKESLQTNDISTGLLAVLLLPLLARTADKYPALKPHMTIVGSEVHAFAAFKEKNVAGSTLAALNKQEHFNSSDRYNITKLIDLFMTRKLATLPLASKVIVNCVNPGLCASEFRKNIDIPKVVSWILESMTRTAEEGAKNFVWAAVECDVSASYVSVTAVKEPSKWSTSEEGLALETKLWEELCVEWKKIAPEVAQTLSV
ncbi:hypothetical protein MNV49_007089 [Pseudohyphozyma bogoriensis]|nr:hypothetical protein MNV49_007089 [Pseudohyphozyma bogoriensis]